jgi:hypothetical protein
MFPTPLPPVDAEQSWPDELEAADAEIPPQDDFDLSRLWRRVRREQAEIDRLKRYLARVAECVNGAIARRQERIDTIKLLTHVYLDHAGVRKVSMPDLGTAYLTTRKHVGLDAAAALEWARQEARQFVLLEPRLDRDGLKKHLLATGEVIPGVAAVEEITTVAFKAH